jgi:hypothetical protein
MRALILASLGLLIACGPPQDPMSASGVSKAHTTVTTGSDGLTVEQRNIVDRLKADNAPGSIKHLYVISAYSGQVLIYSTVRGKVTSSEKRLTPGEASGQSYGFPVIIGGSQYYTSEVLGDDGSYGHSAPYIYWWDVKGVYHQHYVEGGQIVHISSQPLNVPRVVINMESNAAEK